MLETLLLKQLKNLKNETTGGVLHFLLLNTETCVHKLYLS